MTEALTHPIVLQATLHWKPGELHCPGFVLDFMEVTLCVRAEHEQLALHALGQDDIPGGLPLLGLTAECLSDCEDLVGPELGLVGRVLTLRLLPQLQGQLLFALLPSNFAHCNAAGVC
jgi:hypothetical protein